MFPETLLLHEAKPDLIINSIIKTVPGKSIIIHLILGIIQLFKVQIKVQIQLFSFL